MPLWWKTARPFRLLPGGSSCGWEESVVGGTAVLEEEAPCGAEVTAQDRMASATLSALQGGVYAEGNASCCLYVDQSVRVATALQEIRQHTQVLHEVQQDDTSLGVAEVWDWLTWWCPGAGRWFSGLVSLVVIGKVVAACVYVVVRCGRGHCARVLQSCEMPRFQQKEEEMSDLERAHLVPEVPPCHLEVPVISQKDGPPTVSMD